MFQKYLHLERFGTDAVDGINAGLCHIFPKLDGTNASFWMDDEGVFHCASRNRELDIHNDNAGFMNWAIQQENLVEAARFHRNYRFYGEWLVPHSLKTYRDDAWRKFYLFDVLGSNGVFLPYDLYEVICQQFGINYIPCTLQVKNPTYEVLLKHALENTFLLQEGKGYGEGIVIKQYGWINRYGNPAFAKLVTQAFKEAHVAAMGGQKIEVDLVEEKIAQEFITPHLVEKVIAKIRTEEGMFSAKHIPRLLQTVFHDLVTEELWEAVKKHKHPKIDFKLLNQFAVKQTKTLTPALFGI